MVSTGLTDCPLIHEHKRRLAVPFRQIHLSVVKADVFNDIGKVLFGFNDPKVETAVPKSPLTERVGKRALDGVHELREREALRGRPRARAPQARAPAVWEKENIVCLPWYVGQFYFTSSTQHAPPRAVWPGKRGGAA